jgi:hypothetical protein
MAIQAVAVQSFIFPSEHLEQLSRGVSALTIDPYKNALYYFFPFIGAFFSNYNEIREDPAQEAMMPKEPTQQILKEIKNLTDCAGIKQTITPYAALNHQFSTYGGTYSFTKPALFIPDQHLFRRGGHSPFGAETLEENLKEKTWIFSDPETRFLIARELGQMKENSALLRIAIKVAVLAALFTIYMSPFGWTLGAGLFIGVLGLYIVSERLFQARADIVGAQISKSTEAAISALEKMKKQNVHRRENSWVARLYITPKGDNVLDFAHPFLSTRIEALKKCARKS